MSKTKTNAVHAQFDPMDLERNEPGVAERGRLEGVHEDPTTDPEGAAVRANPDAGNMFPAFVFEDFELSKRMGNGQPWADGKEHLVPKRHTIEQIMELHEHGLQPEIFQGMKQRASEQDAYRVERLLTGYRLILSSDDDRMRAFDVMRSIGDICNRKLAERAVRKYQLISALSRANIQDGKMPDFVEKSEERAAKASLEAGIWALVHGTLWLETDYSGSPQYYVRGQVVFALNDQAKFFEQNYRRESVMERASSDDYAKMALLY